MRFSSFTRIRPTAKIFEREASGSGFPKSPFLSILWSFRVPSGTHQMRASYSAGDLADFSPHPGKAIFRVQVVDGGPFLIFKLPRRENFPGGCIFADPAFSGWPEEKRNICARPTPFGHLPDVASPMGRLFSRQLVVATLISLIRRLWIRWAPPMLAGTSPRFPPWSHTRSDGNRIALASGFHVGRSEFLIFSRVRGYGPRCSDGGASSVRRLPRFGICGRGITRWRSLGTLLGSPLGGRPGRSPLCFSGFPSRIWGPTRGMLAFGPIVQRPDSPLEHSRGWIGNPTPDGPSTAPSRYRKTIHLSTCQKLP